MSNTTKEQYMRANMKLTKALAVAEKVIAKQYAELLKLRKRADEVRWAAAGLATLAKGDTT